MDTCFNCGCSLEGEISGHYGDQGRLCIRCLISLLGLPADENFY